MTKTFIAALLATFAAGSVFASDKTNSGKTSAKPKPDYNTCYNDCAAEKRNVGWTSNESNGFCARKCR